MYAQSYEVFKHRELGILSRRPPLQWCRELRYLTDPEKTSFLITQTTTPKTISFMKKYEKYLRKDATSSATNSNASYRKSNNDILNDNSHKIRSDNSFQSKIQTASDKIPKKIKYNDEVYFERLWPKTSNLRKKTVKSTEASETGLTALASFPVSF